MDGGECKQISDAAQKVLRHYDTPAFSAKAMDWVGLLMVAGKVYGPRIAASMAAPKAPRPAPVQRTATGANTEPRAEQVPGGVIISDPLGSGNTFMMPAQN